MTRLKKILLIGGLILLGQVILFSDYLSPIHWGHLKVSGLACTCPDESVDGGQLYLRAITPDSLKKYNLDYSEIYVTKRPYTDLDLEGEGPYIIEGQIIGKMRDYEGDPWNPKFRVDKWREVDILKDVAVKMFFFGQLIVWSIMLLRAKRKTSHNMLDTRLADE